jgi:alpha-L-rhamnosidase
MAAEHERFIWDTGFHFGDWNEPGSSGDSVEDAAKIDHGATATAYLFRSARELAQTAAVLGLSEGAQRFEDLATNVRAAWQQEFMCDGRVEPSTQPNLVRSLAFGLVPESRRVKAVDDLVTLIRQADTHLGTGFLSTPYLRPVLAGNGRLDVAYELLFQRSRRLWLAMLDAGPTTIWDWDSMTEAGRASSSLNYFSMGSFLHEFVAGLQPTSPGYRTLRVRPMPRGGLSWASTHHDSPYGRIDVKWVKQSPGKWNSASSYRSGRGRAWSSVTRKKRSAQAVMCELGFC